MMPTPAQPSRAADRPTSWWLDALRRRAVRREDDGLFLDEPVSFANDEQRRAAIKFFNAAFRAEESGLAQAHQLADAVAVWDADLAEVLRLYGDEEGWHRELLTEFLDFIGGSVNPMGRVTRTLYRLYGRAKRMETIVLTNLMFETIGSTTYRLTLGRIREPAIRRMLTILTRDEAFHVPLNVHFLKRVLERSGPEAQRRLVWIHRLLFVTLVLLPLASRPKSGAFDRIGTRELCRAYAEQLAAVFAGAPELGLAPPRVLLFLLGIEPSAHEENGPAVASAAAAEQAADRENVAVTAL